MMLYTAAINLTKYTTDTSDRPLCPNCGELLVCKRDDWGIYYTCPVCGWAEP